MSGQICKDRIVLRILLSIFIPIKLKQDEAKTVESSRSVVEMERRSADIDLEKLVSKAKKAGETKILLASGKSPQIKPVKLNNFSLNRTNE